MIIVLKETLDNQEQPDLDPRRGKLDGPLNELTRLNEIRFIHVAGPLIHRNHGVQQPPLVGFHVPSRVAMFRHKLNGGILLIVTQGYPLGCEYREHGRAKVV